MPSRRALLAAVGASATAVAGCTRVPGIAVPTVDAQSCPPVDIPADRHVCSHTDTGGEIDVEVSRAEFSTDRESLQALSLELTNGTDAELTVRNDRWTLHRHDGLGWNERAVDGGPDDVATVDPGGQFGWHGADAMFELGATGPTPAGLYAAVLPVSVERESVACVFLFRVTRP